MLEQVLAGREVVARDDDPRLTRGLVYALVDAREPERIRYVGRTRKPMVRFYEHLNYSRPGFAVASDGGVMAMVVLEWVDEPGALVAREAFWLTWFRNQGMADLNTEIPGEPRGPR